jgi:superfamily II DNA or RNA helicase
MPQVVTIAANAVTAKLHEPTREVKLAVQDALSYQVAGAEHSELFKTHRWDGRSSFLDFRAGTFPAGFLHFVSANLRKKGFETRIVRKPFPAPLGPENPKIDAFPEDPRYDYQPEVVRRLIKHGQIIAQVATGGGKSRIARLAYARINRPTLFLTTRSILMYQMKETFEKDLGVGCTVLGDGQFGDTTASGGLSIKKMCVGMVQTLVSRLEETSLEKEFEALYNAVDKKHDAEVESLKKKLKAEGVSATTTRSRVKLLVDQHEKTMKALAPEMHTKAAAKFAERSQIRMQTIKLLEMFEFVILEEAHEASGNSYYEILRHCRNAHYRLALTGTPFMKDSEESNMRLMACSGPIAIKVSEKMLIDRGILATPKFKIIDLKRPPAKLLRTTPWQAAYRLGVVNNDERNQAICAEVLRASRYGMTSMVLVQQTAHGDLLREMLTSKGVRCEFIQGEDDQKARKAALQRLATGKIDCLIGTTILDVGVDVPAVGLIVLAGGGKAEVALRQRIGRGLRAKKAGPNVALVVDFNDPFNEHTKKHALQRMTRIKETEGFGENIIAGDFDFERLGFLIRTAA